MKDNLDYTTKSDGTHTRILWIGVSEENIDTYESMLDELLLIDDLDERMDESEMLLWVIKEDYPELYEDVEDKLKGIIFK